MGGVPRAERKHDGRRENPKRPRGPTHSCRRSGRTLGATKVKRLSPRRRLRYPRSKVQRLLFRGFRPTAAAAFFGADRRRAGAPLSRLPAAVDWRACRDGDPRPATRPASPLAGTAHVSPPGDTKPGTTAAQPAESVQARRRGGRRRPRTPPPAMRSRCSAAAHLVLDRGAGHRACEPQLRAAHALQRAALHRR